LDQWLVADDDDGRVMLGDFNNAVFLEWNENRSRYCKYYSSFTGGFKAPEELRGSFVDESVDPWPAGNFLFSLITGLLPNYSLSQEKRIQRASLGLRPYLDPRYSERSFIESRMVEIMNACHTFKPEERATIFEVVRYLRETKELYNGLPNLVQELASSPKKDGQG
jgi:serine/threonine protein kinase